MVERRQSRISRREFLGRGAKLGAGAAAGLLVGCGDGPSQPNIPQATRIPEISFNPANPENLKPSPTEAALWENKPFIELNPNAAPDEITSLVDTRMTEMFLKMSKSENPELKVASQVYGFLNSEGLLSANSILIEGQEYPTMAVMAYYDQNAQKTLYELQLFLTPLSKRDEIITAVTLAHEARHLVDMLAEAQNLRDRGANEANIALQLLNTGTVEECIEAEARGYATGTRAYINHTWLAPDYRDQEEEFRASKYAAAGFNEHSPEWKQTIRENVRSCMR